MACIHVNSAIKTDFSTIRSTDALYIFRHFFKWTLEVDLIKDWNHFEEISFQKLIERHFLLILMVEDPIKHSTILDKWKKSKKIVESLEWNAIEPVLAAFVCQSRGVRPTVELQRQQRSVCEYRYHDTADTLLTHPTHTYVTIELI